jgi:SAM-dependent methyltransferase
VGARDRSIRFVFDTVVDSYASGRPDMPVEAVREAARAVGLPDGARVLEVGAGTGQLTHALLALGFEVVALEPGDRLRARAQRRAPGAVFRAETFEDFESDGRFDAVVSSNAFHWIDPDVGYAKAAELAGAVVLIWDTAFVADAVLRRRIQEEVMIPHGSRFPTEEAGVREFVAGEIETICDDVRRSSLFAEPWSTVRERRLEYTPERYLDLIGSMGHVAASGKRDTLLAELRPILGDRPFELVDLVWSIAARRR